MNSPETLCSHVLKGKYFPNDEFLAAKNEKNSFHIWRAILLEGKLSNVASSEE
jgi:hypothetical protein